LSGNNLACVFFNSSGNNLSMPSSLDSARRRASGLGAWHSGASGSPAWATPSVYTRPACCVCSDRSPVLLLRRRCSQVHRGPLHRTPRRHARHRRRHRLRGLAAGMFIWDVRVDAHGGHISRVDG
jgi:hypothetical protein